MDDIDIDTASGEELSLDALRTIIARNIDSTSVTSGYVSVSDSTPFIGQTQTNGKLNRVSSDAVATTDFSHLSAADNGTDKDATSSSSLASDENMIRVHSDTTTLSATATYELYPSDVVTTALDDTATSAPDVTDAIESTPSSSTHTFSIGEQISEKVTSGTVTNSQPQSRYVKQRSFRNAAMLYF